MSTDTDSDDSIWIADAEEIVVKSPSNYLLSDIQELQIHSCITDIDAAASSAPSITHHSKGLEIDHVNLRKIDLGRLWQWVSCIIAMDFDMDTGPSLEVVYPPLEFTQEEKKQLAFLSFPDSNTSDHLGDSQFSFRTKAPEVIKKLYKEGIMPEWASSKGGLEIENDGMIYGYVYFRMKRDAERKRGYFQKSLVILSPHPYFSLFKQVHNVIGPICMDSVQKTNNIGEVRGFVVPLFEIACHNISSWPSRPSLMFKDMHMNMPIPLTLPFLGTALNVQMPAAYNVPQFEIILKDEATHYFLASRIELFQTFSENLEQLWLLWELMVLGEPILVIGDTPSVTGDVIWSLVELIKPIPYGGDYRPFFNIQDPDFRRIASKNTQAPNGVIIGVTNRVFDNLLEHWPHVLRICRKGVQSEKYRRKSKTQVQSRLLNFFYSMEITTKYKSTVRKDSSLLKKINERIIGGAPVDVMDLILQRHFVELTDRFMQPFNRYFDLCVVGSPLDMDFLSLKRYPVIKSFSKEQFLAILKEHRPTLPVKTRRSVDHLYVEFLSSCNFASWVQFRTEELNRQWQQMYHENLCSRDLKKWTTERILLKCESDAIKLYTLIQDEIEKYAVYFKPCGNGMQYSDIPGLPTGERSEVAFEITSPLMSPINNDTESIRSSINPEKSFETSNIENQSSPAMSRKSSNSLKNLGELIPSPEQYQKLITQAKIIYENLPAHIQSSLLK